MFTYSTTRLHGFRIEITHLCRFRLVLLPPLHDIRLRICDTFRIPSLARVQRFAWSVDRDIAFDVTMTMTIVDIVSIVRMLGAA